MVGPGGGDGEGWRPPPAASDPLELAAAALPCCSVSFCKAAAAVELTAGGTERLMVVGVSGGGGDTEDGKSWMTGGCWDSPASRGERGAVVAKGRDTVRSGQEGGAAEGEQAGGETKAGRGECGLDMVEEPRSSAYLPYLKKIPLFFPSSFSSYFTYLPVHNISDINLYGNDKCKQHVKKCHCNLSSVIQYDFVKFVE